MAIMDQVLCPHDCCKFEKARPRVTSLRARLPKLLNFCAISFAVAVAGCARNPGPHDLNPTVHEVQAASVRLAARTLRHSEHHRYTQPIIRRPDPALLALQPAPDCEYKKDDLKTVDPDEWARLKTEYELQCYRDAEKAARARLSLLQASIQHIRD
jgi:hypothetical protein